MSWVYYFTAHCTVLLGVVGGQYWMSRSFYSDGWYGFYVAGLVLKVKFCIWSIVLWPRLVEGKLVCRHDRIAGGVFLGGCGRRSRVAKAGS